jgi:hypothetical protein
MSQKSARGGAGGKAPPKGKKAQGGGKKEDDREETLQAVVSAPKLQAMRRNADSLTDTCGFI